ncbi:metal ABC transporter solute-binding protein, Zn/Mn family [Thiocapsa sp. UBA6158]|uniref:metal ABC transporter solute-binding protein, Zn/Mn family n=1 Tax=Thiocapsa sp. UBA6158 TaxID=1947692 RepID=UPI0025D44E8E|nr:zinc ABC transporter substrate-binding protein [Thiocapsa sp. UBA6158]
MAPPNEGNSPMLRRLLPILVLIPGLASAADPLTVFVSVAPQETFVSRIGGEHVRVQALVKAGQDPHAYEPTARQVAALADADLYVRVGIGFEEAWMPRLLAANPSMRLLDARDGIAVRPEDAGHDHGDHDHDHDAIDPHVWTSPARVRIMAARIREALADLAPAYAADFAAGYEGFVADLDALDAAICARLDGVEKRRFMVYHPAWGYFAEDYGLEQVAIEREGKEPGARALTAMIEQARRDGIRVIFVQPQLNPAAAEQVAQAIGGQVAVIDPLSGDYFANLRRVADLIAGAEES